MVELENELWKNILLRIPAILNKIDVEHQCVFKIYFCGLQIPNTPVNITSREAEVCFCELFDKRHILTQNGGEKYFLILKELFYSALVLILSTQTHYQTKWFTNNLELLEAYPSFQLAEYAKEIPHLLLVRNLMLNAMDILSTAKGNKKLVIAIITRLQATVGLAETGRYPIPVSRRKCAIMYEQESGIQPILRAKKRKLNESDQMKNSHNNNNNNISSNNNSNTIMKTSNTMALGSNTKPWYQQMAQPASSAFYQPPYQAVNPCTDMSQLLQFSQDIAQQVHAKVNCSTQYSYGIPAVMGPYSYSYRVVAPVPSINELELQSMINRRKRDFM